MSILKKGIITSMSSYLSLGLGLVQTMIVSRALGPELVGQMSLLRQVAVFGAQIGSFGLPMGIIYFINKRKLDRDTVIGSTLIATQLLSLLSSVIVALMLIYADFFGEVNIIIILSVIGFIFFSNSRTVFHSLNIADQDVKRMSLIDVLPTVLCVGILLFLYLYDLLNLNNILFLNIFIWPLIGLILALLIQKNRIKLTFSINVKYLKEAFSYGSQVNLSDFLVLINSSITLFILKYYTSDFTSVGYFSRAISVTTLINTAFISFLRLLYSHWAQLSGIELKKSVERIMNFLVLVSIVGCILIGLFGDWIVLILFGKEFLPATSLVQIIIFGATGFLISKSLLKLFISDGNVKYNLVCLLVGGISNIILSVILIKLYGVKGAGFAQLFSSILMGLTALYIAKSRYGISISRILIPNFSIKNIKNIIKR
ncbi:oligosaccharide flippase family protein [Sphingobacteruim zhuxiongii]|nr:MULTISPECIES: oligosaccharide flippase family protein [unclassified Sphingobacterium]